jgi:hypothetical protein
MIFLFPYFPSENINFFEFDGVEDVDVARAMATHLQN